MATWCKGILKAYKQSKRITPSTVKLDNKTYDDVMGNNEDRGKFKGQKAHFKNPAYSKCKALKTSIYNIGNAKTLSTNITRDIAEFVGANYNGAGNLCTGMIDMKLSPIVSPT